MSAEFLLSGRWSRGQWLGWIALMFAAQVALLFWLGDPKPKAPERSRPAPLLRMAGASSGAGELLALMDPTLFALPHRQGFSGPAWLVVTPQKFEPYVWSNPPGWLELPLAGLGGAFQQFIETNPFTIARVLPQPQLELTMPELEETSFLPRDSGFRLAGDLAWRRMLNSPTLPSWSNPELLTNSVVQLVVDAAGRPVSLTLLAGSGSKDADDYALAQARAARFEPAAAVGVSPALAGLSWGQLIFEWRTTPQLTNLPAGAQ